MEDIQLTEAEVPEQATDPPLPPLENRAYDRS